MRNARATCGALSYNLGTTISDPEEATCQAIPESAAV